MIQDREVLKMTKMIIYHHPVSSEIILWLLPQDPEQEPKGVLWTSQMCKVESWKEKEAEDCLTSEPQSHVKSDDLLKPQAFIP